MLKVLMRPGNVSVRYVLEYIERWQAQHPGRECWYDGDMKAIVTYWD